MLRHVNITFYRTFFFFFFLVYIDILPEQPAVLFRKWIKNILEGWLIEIPSPLKENVVFAPRQPCRKFRIRIRVFWSDPDTVLFLGSDPVFSEGQIRFFL